MLSCLSNTDHSVVQSFASPVADTRGLWVITASQAAKTEDDLNAVLSRAATDFGSSYYSYSGRFTIDSRTSFAKVLSSRSSVSTVLSNGSYDRVLSMVVRHAQGRLTPFFWSKACSAASGVQDFQDLCGEARLLGLHDGVSYPIHDATGDFGVLSFAASERAFGDAYCSHRLLADGLLVAAFTHDAMRRLVNKSAKILEKPLTERESECLRLIAIGKSTWEMSKILGLSEHGVLHHVRSLMSKFGVHHRHQAVIRATACGLI